MFLKMPEVDVVYSSTNLLSERRLNTMYLSV